MWPQKKKSTKQKEITKAKNYADMCVVMFIWTQQQTY